MIKLILSFARAIQPLKRSDVDTKKYAAILLIVLMNIPTLYSQNYYVSSNATGTGNGTQGNPWTIYQAASNAVAGDIVYLAAGNYGLSSVLSFNNSGTASNPIVFRGVRVDGDEKTLNDGCTVLRQDNSVTNDQINLNGNYIILENMVMLQQYPKYLVVLNGDHCTLDSVVTQYPSNASSSSNHTVRITGDYATLRYSYFWQSPRTVIWVRNNNGTHCTGFLMEYCTITGYDNHYAIQCMPSTQIGGDPANYRLEDGTIRNNIFINVGHSYESAIYLRNVHNYKVYNNIFVEAGERYGQINFATGDGIIDTASAYHAESIFANNTVYDPRTSATTQALLHAATNMNGWTFVNNIVYMGYWANIYNGFCFQSPTPSLQGYTIDYNLYYKPNGDATSGTVGSWTTLNSCGTNSYNWSGWRGRGYDGNSIVNIDPDFVNPTLDPDTWDFRLGSEIPGIDLSSWGITTDYNGNTRTNWTIGAFEFNGIDLTPPRVMGATLINATTLRITFSEPIALPGAENPSNYAINNGIAINSISYSGSQATLITSAHTNGNYIVTVNNVTDASGNVVNPNNNSAQYSFQIDVTPPELIGASIIDSVTLRLSFSEALDPNSGHNINNYSISNGISVLGANISDVVVTLSTSEHSTGSYTVTVNNVADIAGNLISPQNNSLNYEFQSGSSDNSILLPVSSVEASVVPEPNHYPEKTVDGMGYYQGDPDSRWAGDTMPEWLVYDLGGVQLINQTKFSFYNWNVGRIYNYTVQVSNDNVNWNEVKTNVQSSLQEWSIEDLGSIEARYIKIIFVANNQNAWAGLWESEFWGHILNPTNIEDEKTAPTTFVMDQNYPNPFNPTTMIRVSLPKSSHIKLTVYNILGEYITELANGQFDSGVYEFNFNASGLSSGLYIYRIESSDFVETKKMMVMK